MKKIKISVITPCFNSEKTIRKTIEQMLNQTYQNFEYIIVDGSSRDNTLKIIEEYKDTFKGKLHVISEPDSGIYDAMNKGIHMATGDIIGIINSDDWYEVDTLENVVENYQGNQYEVVYGMKRTIDHEMERMVELKRHEFLPKQMICHPSCFITRKCYEEIGEYDTSYKSSADYALMLEYYHSSKVVFIPVYKVLANFRTGGMSSSQLSYRETLKLKYKYGYIKSFYYHTHILKSKISELIKGKMVN